MKIQKIISILEKWAPRAYAEEFDNVGLLVGKAEAECTGILITHDVLENVVDESITKKYNFILCFHPIIFSGLKKITGKHMWNVVAKGLKTTLHLCNPYGAGQSQKGVSHSLANVLELSDIKILVPQKKTLKNLIVYVPKENSNSLLEKLYEAGAGALGNYDQCSFVTPGKGSFRGNENSKPHLGIPMKREEVEEVQINLVFQKHLEKKILKTLFENHLMRRLLNFINWIIKI